MGSSIVICPNFGNGFESKLNHFIPLIEMEVAVISCFNFNVSSVDTDIESTVMERLRISILISENDRL